jgi:GNAT superfamily N-acetyltransferase
MLIDALADYEKLKPPTDEAKQRLLADAFAERPRFTILLAESDGDICGYAFLLETYSTFLALPTLYLEDLFVLPEFRSTGAGSALFQAVKDEAKARGCGRVEFVVLKWNQLAKDFYHRKGGKHLEDWDFYRVDAADF